MPSPAGVSHVYVIARTANRRVLKIGRTVDLGRRLADLQLRSGSVSLEVLWTTPGGSVLELGLHRRFADRRIVDEWFDFTDVQGDPVELIAGAAAELAGHITVDESTSGKFTQEDDLLTSAEVLDLLRSNDRAITASTWRGYVARNQAPQPAKHVGRTPLWNRSEVEQWVGRNDQ